jgi:hypothetical protein
MEQAPQGQPAPTQISADEIRLTVTDKLTGAVFTRTLPMEYLENDNGIRLRGENMEGQAVEMVFLSNSAVSKIQDLTGKGPDAPKKNHGF